MGLPIHIGTWLVFYLASPLLLIARALRPARVPWWLVIAVAAALGWVCLALDNRFYPPYLRPLTANDVPPGVDYRYVLIDYWIPPAYYGSMYELVYLAVCSAIAAGMRLLRRHRARV